MINTLINRLTGFGAKRQAQDQLLEEMKSAATERQPPVEKSVLREAAGVTIDDDEEQWRPLSGDSKRDLSPVTAQRMRDIALHLWQSNLLANRLIELPTAYILGEGVKLTSGDEASQKLLDRFWRDPINSMDLKLPKKVRELSLYGEQCYPVFVNKYTGMVRLGYLNPNHIATVVMDPDNPEQPIGVVTVKDKKGDARKYRVIINGPEDCFTPRTQGIRETFTDGECFYFAINDLSDGARGRSDLLAQADYIDGYDQFLFGELDRTQFMRAFMWDVTLKGASEEQVKAKAATITAPAPNSTRVHNDAEEWKAVTPTLNSGETKEAASLFRNHVLGGATLPEHWFGGGGDVNRAVGAEMGEPTFKTFSQRQQYIKHMLEAIGLYAIRQAHIAAGVTELEFDDPTLEVTAIFPEMTSKDISKYAAALQQVASAVMILVDKGLLTEEKALEIVNAIAGRLGVEMDVDDVLAEAKAALADAKKRQQADDSFQIPPEPPVQDNEE